jgi:lysophospholipid acyltransferase (LPLAT)-like uncharacterized protein
VIDALEQSGQRVLVMTWHGEYRPLLVAVRDRPVVTLTTDTFRGRIIQAAVEALGHWAIRRPPGLHGGAALGFIRDAIADAPRVVIVADGPSGPAHRVKPGVLQLARDLQLRLVPVASAVRPAYTRHRWDRQQIAPPFARVAVVVGPALPVVPDRICGAELERWLGRLGAEIDEAGRAATRRVDVACTHEE